MSHKIPVTHLGLGDTDNPRLGQLFHDVERNVILSYRDQAFRSVAQPEGWINVKDFGAKGDGNNDDTQAFLDALDYALSNQLHLYIPKGKYKITQSIVIDGSLYEYPGGNSVYLSVFGDEERSSIIQFHDLENNDSIAIEIKGIARFDFRNLTIEGNSSNIKGIGLKLGDESSDKSITYSNISNILVRYFNTGIYFNWIWSTSTNKIEVRYCNTNMYFNGGTEIQLSQFFCEGYYHTGIKIDSWNLAKFENGTIEGSKSTSSDVVIVADNFKHLIFDGIWFEDNISNKYALIGYNTPISSKNKSFILRDSNIAYRKPFEIYNTNRVEINTSFNIKGTSLFVDDSCDFITINSYPQPASGFIVPAFPSLIYKTNFIKLTDISYLNLDNSIQLSLSYANASLVGNKIKVENDLTYPDDVGIIRIKIIGDLLNYLVNYIKKFTINIPCSIETDYYINADPYSFMNHLVQYKDTSANTQIWYPSENRNNDLIFYNYPQRVIIPFDFDINKFFNEVSDFSNFENLQIVIRLNKSGDTKTSNQYIYLEDLQINYGIMNPKYQVTPYEDHNSIASINSSNIPTAGIPGRIAFLTDTNQIAIDNGTTWVKVTLS